MNNLPSGSNDVPQFSQSVIEQIGYYVYLLIDPQTDETFYVGKGKGNRIFAHVNDAISSPDASDKLDRIRTIRERGDDVRHLILRHGLTEKEAFEIEAAVIDLLDIKGLTNLVSGFDSQERGLMTIRDVISLYEARAITFEEPVLLIIVNRLFDFGMTPDELYEVTRGNWDIGQRRDQVKYACAVYKGIVREVYRVHSWFPVQARRETSKKQERWRFEGEVAAEMQHYVGGDVRHYLERNQSPIRYINF